MNIIEFIKNKDFKKNICFIHVPKCAGTSINKAIYRKYGFISRRLKQKYFYHFSAMAATKGAELLNEDLYEYRQKILIYLLSKGSYVFISGHFPFTDLAMNHFSDRWDFMTILRNPVDRWFSHYFFNRRKKDHHFKTDLSIDAYADSEDGKNLGTLYHKYFNGEKEADKINLDESYQKVINNLNKFKCIGITEHMDIFCRDFNECFGIKLSVGSKNKSPFSKKEQSDLIRESVRKKVEKICAPDLKVYNYVKDKILKEY